MLLFYFKFAVVCCKYKWFLNINPMSHNFALNSLSCSAVLLLCCLWITTLYASFFPIYITFMSFFMRLYWLEPPVQCWIDVIRVDIFVFFLPLGENIQLFTINYSISCMLIIDTLDQVKEVFFYSWEFLM